MQLILLIDIAQREHNRRTHMPTKMLIIGKDPLVLQLPHEHSDYTLWTLEPPHFLRDPKTSRGSGCSTNLYDDLVEKQPKAYPVQTTLLESLELLGRRTKHFLKEPARQEVRKQKHLPPSTLLVEVGKGKIKDVH